MNAPTAAVLSSFALGVGGVSTYLALSPRGDSAVAAASASDSTVVRTGGESALEAGLRELRAEVAELEARVATAATAPRTSLQLDEDAIARAVAAYMESRGDVALAEPSSLDGTGELATAEDAFALLADAGSVRSTELWKEIVEKGLDDEVIALFEAAAEADPNDPEAQLALGTAYLGLTQEAGASPLAGKYATLADQALDRALEADPQHWDARFTKATALSFWPPVFGKQAAAIQQFETLVSQQAGMAPTARHADTHLLLGNMYQQTGQMEKAVKAWQQGLQLFPGNSDLAAQIALATGNGGGY
ncbi:MAG: tetratricopeptide repeat protein [Planctomycetota bacterium]